MANELELLLDRLVEMEQAVYQGSDSVPIAFYAQEASPYWTNRIDGASIELDSEEKQDITYSINMRLVIGNVTEGWENEAEKRIHIWMPVILRYFGERRLLKRDNNDAPLDFLLPQGAVITNAQADYNMQNSGIGVTQFGIDFTIEVPMYQMIEQVIY